MTGGWKAAVPILVVIILTLSGLTLTPDDGGEETIPRVQILGGGSFDTIQGAVDAASDGDVILLSSGVYSDPLVVDKPLTIIGTEEDVVRTAEIRVTDSAQVSGIDFKNIWNGFTWGGAIYLSHPGGKPYSKQITVQDCTFTNCSRGIYLFASGGSLVQRCTFTNCHRGITIDPHLNSYENIFPAYNRIYYCDFKNIKYSGNYEGEAIMLNQTSHTSITDCTMDGCAFGLVAYRGTGHWLYRSTISNSTVMPIYIYESYADIQSNTLRDNNWNAHFLKCTSGRFRDNTVINNTGPICLDQSRSIQVYSNYINGDSIQFRKSVSCSVWSNTFNASDTRTLEFVTSAQSHYSHSIATSNTVGGNPIYYYYNQADPSLVNATIGSAYFVHCTNPTVTWGNVTDGDGIVVINSPGANISTNLTNCLLGMDLENSQDGLIEGCNINTSERGTAGIRLSNSLGTEVWNTHIETPMNETPAWRIEGGHVYSCYNTSFDYFDVNATENSGGTLEVYSHLTLRVLANETLSPMEGVDALLREGTSDVHRTSHYLGSDDGTDASGELGPFLLLDREYKHFAIPKELDHDLELWTEVDAEWSTTLQDINMSMDLLLEFETADIWKPQIPLNLIVTDLPDKDAINVSWDINTDDTQVYSVYSNVSGAWSLVGNVTSPFDSLILDEGLVHGETYYFALSAWDEVPLESNWSNVASVVHEDGIIPDIPTGLRALEVNGTNLTLGWDPSIDLDLAGYKVYINATGGDETGPWVDITPAMGLLDPGLWVTGLASETTYHFVITAIDERPNESPFSQVLSVTTADITPPEAPLLETLPEFTNVKVHTIKGTAEPGSTLTLFLNGEVFATITVGPSGDLVMEVTLVDGINIITAWATDASANTGPLSAEIGSFLDQEAPMAPRLDALPELTNVVGHTVSGTCEPLSKVTIIHNGVEVGTVDIGPDGTFELSVDMVEGENLITAHATDRALNTGPQATVLTVVLDTIAPEMPVIDDLPEYTNQEAHSIEGVAEVGSLVELLVNGEVVAKVDAAEDGSFKFNHILEDRETVIAAQATDPAGNLGEMSTIWTMILDQTSPTAVAGVDLEAIEETEMTFDASESSDNEGIAAYQWTFDLDGVEMTLDGEAVVYTFPDVVEITITLTVTDLAGNIGEDTLVATIVTKNKAPTLSGDEVTPDKGTTKTEFLITVKFTDEDGDTGQVFVVIDGVPYPMLPDPNDSDTTDGQTFTFGTQLGKGEHEYYFTGKDSFGWDAEGPSAGEDNSKSSPDVTKHQVEDTPGAWSSLTLLAVISVLALRRLRVRKGNR